MNITSEFPTWEILASFPGALGMVLGLTQLTKEARFIKNIPTRYWSYILAAIVLFPATYFTGQMDPDSAFLIFFQAAGISLAANGSFSAIKKTFGKPAATDGDLLIDSSNPEKDIYRFDVGSIDDLLNKKTITLCVKPGCDLSQKE